MNGFVTVRVTQWGWQSGQGSSRPGLPSPCPPAITAALAPALLSPAAEAREDNEEPKGTLYPTGGGSVGLLRLGSAALRPKSMEEVRLRTQELECSGPHRTRAPGYHLPSAWALRITVMGCGYPPHVAPSC